MYRGVRLKTDFRYDMLVNGTQLLQLKSVETLLPVHKKQTLTYLCPLKVQKGVLINFSEEVLRLASSAYSTPSNRPRKHDIRSHRIGLPASVPL